MSLNAASKALQMLRPCSYCPSSSRLEKSGHCQAKSTVNGRGGNSQIKNSRRELLNRSFLALSSSFFSSLAISPSSHAFTSASHQVRLEDVESKELQKALKFAFEEDFDAAEKLFDQLVVDNPSSASIWSNRGSVRMSVGRFEEAISDFTQAIKLAPYAPVPFLNRAIAHEALKKFPQAISDCREAIRLDPNEYAAWFNLGNVEQKVEDYEAAMFAFQQAADLAPGIAGYRLREANICFQVGRVEDSFHLLNSIVRKYPNYVEAQLSLASVLWSMDRRSEAEDHLNSASVVDSRVKNISWVKSVYQWPPSMLTALDNFLKIKSSSSVG